MFRIRESFPDNATVYLWFDGRLSEEDLDTAGKIVHGYLAEQKKVYINLSNLIHVGWAGKRFLKEIKNKVFFEEEPEHLKAGVLKY